AFAHGRYRLPSSRVLLRLRSTRGAAGTFQSVTNKEDARGGTQCDTRAGLTSKGAEKGPQLFGDVLPFGMAPRRTFSTADKEDLMLPYSVFLILDFIGLIAFSISGAIAGVRKELDIYGVFLLATV